MTLQEADRAIAEARANTDAILARIQELLREINEIAGERK